MGTTESTKQRIHLTLSSEALNNIARDADAATRTLSQQIEHVYGRLLSGPERLAELEELANKTMAKSSRPPSTAAADHLREHRLCGMDSPNEETTDNAD